MHPILRKIHRCSGLVLAVFAGVHLYNHLLLAADPQGAFAFMGGFRHIYRTAAAETLLLAAVLAQVATGPMLARQRSTDAPRAAPTARLSGYYLLFFLLVHVAAVLWGRLGLGLDTDIRFAAAGLRAWTSAAFFIPYYFLAVVAVCVHAGLGIGALLAAPARATLPVSLAAGALGGAAIVGGMLALAQDRGPGFSDALRHAPGMAGHAALNNAASDSGPGLVQPPVGAAGGSGARVSSLPHKQAR